MAKELSLEEVKKIPYKTLNRLLDKLKKFLKTDETTLKMFEEYEIDIEEIDYIPMMFGEIDVSAKTDHGIIIFNYALLTDGDFFEDFSYGVHEITHWLQQTAGDKATRSSDDGSYLKNPFEQEGFQNQIEYIANQSGEDKAEEYVDKLLEHHDINNTREKKKLKTTLMKKI